MKIFKVLTLVFFTAVYAAISVSAQTAKPTEFEPPYFPTPPEVVDAMLKLAKVTSGDVIYDLGSGDGRIVIAAAKYYGASGVGIDINKKLVKKARKNARQAGVVDKVKFVESDVFATDFSRATVVTLYLLPRINLKLKPILLEQLKPGTRIVSHAFGIGDWKPEQTIKVNGSTIYFWTVPEKKPE